MTAFMKNNQADTLRENIDIWFCKVCMNKKIRQIPKKFKDLKNNDNLLTQIKYGMFISPS